MMKTTPIQVYIRDVPEDPKWDWKLGIWEWSMEQEAWGLVFGSNRTQMCYEWPQSNAKTIIERNRANSLKDLHPDWLRWYFDVGRRLYVTHDDLEVACKELGIWE